MAAGRGKGSRVTIRTVAEDAGVSTAAVSKVLRDAYGVSAALRAKVETSVARLGYRPNASARGMRGQTYTLGVLLPDLHNPFFSDIMTGVNEALVRTQYQALLGVGQSAEALEHALVDAMIDRQMDGLILISPRMPMTELVAIAERVPTTVIGIHAPDIAAFDTVNNDDIEGAKMVVRHLEEGGYRNVAFLSLDLPRDQGGSPISHRERGYRDAMAEIGMARRIKVILAQQNPRDIQHTVGHVLTSRGRPDAIFCWTDFIALEVLSIAREVGLSVPGDLGVVGYDNTSYCDLAQNSLTSIDQSGQVLGLQAARLLIERIKGRAAAEHFVVTPRLVARGSSSP
jgi:DNA-binding LacI/PurR family transcriptional regulator